jgi:hypothetical protein
MSRCSRSGSRSISSSRIGLISSQLASRLGLGCAMAWASCNRVRRRAAPRRTLPAVRLATRCSQPPTGARRKTPAREASTAKVA